MQVHLTPDTTGTLAHRLRTCSYTDFIGMIGQTNVPPGAFATVSQWAHHSRMGPDSMVYEVACTTGFSLRESSRLTGCTGEGADISATSVRTAQRMVEGTPLASRLRFVHADAAEFRPSCPPSHIIVGGALRFFPDPERMIERCTELFGDHGYLLAAPFHAIGVIPDRLLEQARRILGIVPTTENYKEVMWPYRGFQVVHEARLAIEQETPQELVHYCTSTARRAMSLLGSTDADAYSVAYERLHAIKDLCNKLRRYQGYSVLVLRYAQEEYPARFVELF